MKISKTEALLSACLPFCMIAAFAHTALLYAEKIGENEPAAALSPVNPEDFPDFADGGGRKGLLESIEHSLAYYKALPSYTSFYFGQDVYSAATLIDSLKRLQVILKNPIEPAKLNEIFKKEFSVYKSAGAGAQGKVTFSSYYEASLKAKFSSDAEYRYPLYARPADLLDADLGSFVPRLKGERIAGRAEGKNILPYYTREDIDSGGAIKGRGLEIAWAKNPLDILFLQIQGSGWIEIAGSTQIYHIRYAGDNGRPFVSVGQYLIGSGRIPGEGFTKDRMIDYLNGLSEAERQSMLNRNPRYIFFEITSATTATRGSLLVPLTAERSIASDPKFYPPGALAWIKTERPVFDSDWKLAGKEAFSGFVLNQDEGGAIKGAGRIDFFAGRGKKAEKMAEKLWFTGDLYFFVKKLK